ncbi:hypothetical protein HID58_045774 [Brassica napus]|uniref:Uncharacterized protein n=1 Tax=Brassica napus TaxID=3708 RepID=A0ABQ8AUK0_BRANA|nr:hypothetical protein HID58_045774 [Brassica napus]
MVVALKFEHRTSKGGKETTMLWLWTCSGPAYGIYGILQGKHSNVSSPCFGFDNPHVAYQMRKTIISNVLITFLIMITSCLSSLYHPNHHKRYFAIIVPTTNLITFQNERACMNPNIFNHVSYPPTFRKILNPIVPLSTIPHKSSLYPRNLYLFSFSPKHHNDKYVLLRRRIFKKRSNLTKFFEEIFDDFYFEGDDEYNGIKHSLPYKNIGPYIYMSQIQKFV